MIEMYAHAAVVLTTADWEDVEVPMVKHRLLDTAMLGAFQIAQDSADLRAYFPAEEVPSYRDAGELCAQVARALEDPAGRRRAARAARARALVEHTWTRRWPELIAGLALDDRRAESRSVLFDHLLLALGTRAEGDGRAGAAAALFAELVARDPDEPAAAAGLGRCLRDLGSPEAALPHLRRAAASPALRPLCAATLEVGIPPAGVGTGLGRLARFPPAAEPLAYLIAILVELGRVAEARAELDAITDERLAHTLAVTLRSDEPLPGAIEDWITSQTSSAR
jgi:hypothetical protein